MYRRTPGPSDDLEVFAYERRDFDSLPNSFPRSGMQGEQILDFQNRHVESAQTWQMVGFHDTNDLCFERFVGQFHRHVNEPLPLSVNEVMYDTSSLPQNP